MIREGMEDYEYLKLLADLGDRDGARTIARDLFPNAYSTDVDPAKLLAARQALATRILQRQGKTPPSDAVANGGTGAAAGGSGGGGGGCGSAGGLGAWALLALPGLIGLRRRRRRA
jgi:uncharacterized protein (TIGR03382 family)